MQLRTGTGGSTCSKRVRLDRNVLHLVVTILANFEELLSLSVLLMANSAALAVNPCRRRGRLNWLLVFTVDELSQSTVVESHKDSTAHGLHPGCIDMQLSLKISITLEPSLPPSQMQS